MKSFALIILTIFLTVLFPGIAKSSQPSSEPSKIDLSSFAKITVLDEGRLKPLDTYARNTLLRFSGRNSYNKQAAINWLAKAMFTPKLTFKDKVFIIDNPEIPEALGIEPDHKRRYSFEQLEGSRKQLFDYASKAAEKEDKERNPLEKEFLRTYMNLDSYSQIINALGYMESNKDFELSDPELLRELNFSEAKEFSLYEVLNGIKYYFEENLIIRDSKKEAGKSNKQIKAKTQAQINQTRDRLIKWIEYLAFFKNTQSLSQTLEIIPIIHTEKKELWVDPVIGFLEFHDSSNAEIDSLFDMRKAYIQNNQQLFDQSIQNFNSNVDSKLAKVNIQKPKSSIELFYNNFAPLFKAKLLYGFALLALLFSFLFWKNILHPLSFSLISLGLVSHTAAVTCRMIITGRPPVTNLYETFVFVALVAVILGILLEVFGSKKQSKQILGNQMGSLVAAFAGLVLLMIAQKYSADGDTMKVMIAVLDSNFWLSTHVIAITVGYAGVCVAGLIGHIYLIQRLFKANDYKLLQNTYSMILGVLGFGLTFTFLGTMLGGIWADQSWGRFWGWDPKENGALLIVLWSLVVFHAKEAKIVKEIGVAIGAIIGIYAVLLAWFGINLLSVGLHSYGFTDGTANGLLIFGAFEIIFISSFFILQKTNLPLMKRS